MRAELTLDFLRSILHYEPETGRFTWLVSRMWRIKAGDVAGHVLATNGYRRINIRGKVYFAHRLAFFYMTGKWPAGDVDHKLGHRDDNRWSQIRPATRAENMMNLQGPHRDNKVGLLGVSPCNGRFAAHIRLKGRNKYLGTFDTPELAHAAYLNAKDGAVQPRDGLPS